MSKLINKNLIGFGPLLLVIMAVFPFTALAMPIREALAAPTFVSGHYNADGSYTYGDFYWNDSGSTSSNNGNGTTSQTPTVSSTSPKSSSVNAPTQSVTVVGSGFNSSSVVKINNSNRPTTFIDSSHLLVQVTQSDLYKYQSNGGFYITVYNSDYGGVYSNAVYFTITKASGTSGTTTNSNTNTYYSGTNTNTNSNSNYTNSQTQSSNDYNSDYNYSNNSNGNNGGNNGANGGGSVGSLAANAIFGVNSFAPSGLIQWVLFAIIILLIVIIVRKFFGGEDRYHSKPLKHA